MSIGPLDKQHALLHAFLYTMSYLHKHNHTLAQDFPDGRSVIVVTLENFLFQKLACGQMEGFTGPVEPAAIQPLLSFPPKDHMWVTELFNSIWSRPIYIHSNWINLID